MNEEPRRRPLKPTWVLDDETEVRGVIRDTIRSAFPDAFVAEFASGGEALQAFERAPQYTLPHILISDMMLKDIDGTLEMDGIEVARRMKEKRPALRVLLVTGEDIETEEVRKAMAVGTINAVLHKPFPPEKLIDSLRSLWGDS